MLQMIHKTIQNPKSIDIVQTITTEHNKLIPKTRSATLSNSLLIQQTQLICFYVNVITITDLKLST